MTVMKPVKDVPKTQNLDCNIVGILDKILAVVSSSRGQTGLRKGIVNMMAAKN